MRMAEPGLPCSDVLVWPPSQQTWPIKLGHLILRLCSMEQSSMVSML